MIQPSNIHKYFMLSLLMLIVSCEVNNSFTGDTAFVDGPIQPENPDEPASAFTQVKNIIRTNCISCHGNYADLETEDDFVNNFPAKFSGVVEDGVVAGEPEDSILYQRLIGVGSIMPSSPNEPLSQSDIDIIYNWIFDL